MRSYPTKLTGNSAPDFEHNTISEQSRALASRLSGHMGIEGALQVSAENQWHGVVAALMEIKQRKS